MLISVFLFVLLVGSNVSAQPQTQSITDLLNRVVGPKAAAKFSFGINPPPAGSNATDSFTINAQNDAVNIQATSLVAATAGVHHYLRFYAGCSVTWGAEHSGNYLVLPDVLPSTNGPVTQSTLGLYRYYYNVCTYGYSTAFWSWKQWEQEIDWMALHGINMPLAFLGQEYVWLQTFLSFNLTFDDVVNGQFTGPAFLPWERMGNIRKWAGPLSVQYMLSQVNLQVRVLQRMRSLGMKPVLPAFAGFVPQGFVRVYPNASVIRSADWLGNMSYSGDYLLNPNDPLFVAIGAQYLKIQTELFGTDHYYQCDTWNEMNPPQGGLPYLTATSAAVYKSINQYDPKGVWVMQGWLFYSGRGFWTNDRIQAYLQGVPKSSLIILDLTSEHTPVFKETNGYFGYQFIWCMLHNYGGQRGLYGNLSLISSQPVMDYQSGTYPNMVGVGLTMEAIEQNPIIYELMLDVAWRATPMTSNDLTTWIQAYARSRYGSSVYADAFQILTASDGSYSQFPSCCPTYTGMVARPTFDVQGVFMGYNATKMRLAWNVFNTNRVSSPPSTLQYDFIDFTRQIVGNLFVDVHQSLANTLRIDTETPVPNIVSAFRPVMLDLITDLDALMSADVNFLMGRWIQLARFAATSGTESDLFEFNARTQVTLWGPMGLVGDYAGKPWGGLLGQYHAMRWTSFLNVLSVNGTNFNDQIFSNFIYPQEFAFTMSTDSSAMPSTPVGSATAIIDQIQSKYFSASLSGYNVQTNSYPGSFTLLHQPWNQDVESLTYLCNINPSCRGFTSDGKLFLNFAREVMKPGYNFYIKTQ